MHIQKLKMLRIKKKERFVILLWFASLALWLAWWVNGTKNEKQVHPKKKRSFFRIFWEELQFALHTNELKQKKQKFPTNYPTAGGSAILQKILPLDKLSKTCIR